MAARDWWCDWRAPQRPSKCAPIDKRKNQAEFANLPKGTRRVCHNWASPIMNVRLSAALLAGRAAATLSRRLGRGGGTVIAGHLVSRLAPDALQDVTRALPSGSIVVSGTNGKTTTTRLLSHVCIGAGMRPIHNRAGANLLSGLFSTVVQATDWQARPRGDIGVFEGDEATVPAALDHIQPRVLLLHNVFRDQLDRYGEVHFVARLWREAVLKLPSTTAVAVNADDPLVAALPSRL